MALKLISINNHQSATVDIKVPKMYHGQSDYRWKLKPANAAVSLVGKRMRFISLVQILQGLSRDLVAFRSCFFFLNFLFCLSDRRKPKFKNADLEYVHE